MSAVNIVIPVREGGNPETALRSLATQTFTDFDVIVSWDKQNNANSARNRGKRLSNAPFLLFSDDDIKWEPGALELLMRTLEQHPEAAYAYGAYAMGNWIQCNRPFSAARLRQTNFISTMSLIRRGCFPGFDEAIPRLQDWDLWLTMLARGHRGVYCGEQIFTTEKGDGISYGDGVSHAEAVRIVKEKHQLQ